MGKVSLVFVVFVKRGGSCYSWYSCYSCYRFFCFFLAPGRRLHTPDGIASSYSLFQTDRRRDACVPSGVSFLVQPGGRTSFGGLCCLAAFGLLFSSSRFRVVFESFPTFFRDWQDGHSIHKRGGFCENCKKNGEILLFSKKSRNFAADLVKD